MTSAFNPTELKYLLECGICLNRFQDPRVLPCLHSYCLDCLKNHISATKTKDGAFDCPQCRENSQVPTEGVETFPKNFFVNTMKDIVPESALQESNADAPKKTNPPMCKHRSEDSEGEHGTAVVYCDQCEAHLCLTCSKSHRLFFKDHKVVAREDDNREEQDTSILSGGCKLHQNLPINWYCKECSLPACPECIIEKHEGHPKERLAIREAALKQDMLDVSVMAVKRLDTLQKISADMKSNEVKMEEELDKVNKEITVTADSLCKLIRQHEATLKEKVREAREEARTIFETANEKMETAKKNLTGLKSCAETLHQSPSEKGIFTVLQSPITEQQILHQQDVPVPFVDWDFKRESEEITPHRLLGDIDTNLSVESDRMCQPGHISLGEPLKTIPLQYTDNKAVCGIVPIYGSKVCVAHVGEEHFWSYSQDGQLEHKIKIPGVTGITGMVVVEEKNGKLAIVDNKEPKVHFVTFSGALTVVQHVIKELPMIPHRIFSSNQKEFVLSSLKQKRCVIVNIDGQVLSDVNLTIPYDKVSICSTCKTKSGLVVCDSQNQSIYFTDTSGQVLCTRTDCSSPWQAVPTSWGHVLIADHLGNTVRVFSEIGECLGNLRDNAGSIIRPNWAHVDETERLVYVCCGNPGKMEMRVYKFALSDLQPLPITRSITKLTTHLNLVKV